MRSFDELHAHLTAGQHSSHKAIPSCVTGVGRPVGADAAQRAGARSEGKRTMVDYVLRPQTGMKPKPKPKPKRSLRQRQLTRTVLPEEHPQYSVQADGEEAAVRHGAAINDGHDHDDDDATAAAMVRA